MDSIAAARGATVSLRFDLVLELRRCCTLRRRLAVTIIIIIIIIISNWSSVESFSFGCIQCC